MTQFLGRRREGILKELYIIHDHNGWSSSMVYQPLWSSPLYSKSAGNKKSTMSDAAQLEWFGFSPWACRSEISSYLLIGYKTIRHRPPIYLAPSSNLPDLSTHVTRVGKGLRASMNHPSTKSINYEGLTSYGNSTDTQFLRGSLRPPSACRVNQVFLMTTHRALIWKLGLKVTKIQSCQWNSAR